MNEISTLIYIAHIKNNFTKFNSFFFKILISKCFFNFEPNNVHLIRKKLLTMKKNTCSQQYSNCFKHEKNF